MCALLRFGWSWALASVIAAASTAPADDAYYRVPLRDLKIVEGAFPALSEESTWRHRSPEPYAALDGSGEVLVEFAPNGGRRWPYDPDSGSLVACSPAGREVSGRLFYPIPAGEHDPAPAMTVLRFTVPSNAARPEAINDFRRAKRRHYQDLLSRGVPGGAWFRHQLRMMPDPDAKQDPDRSWQRVERQREFERTYELLSGGRAISENLQLDRALARAPANETPVPVDSIRGITVAEIDWTPLVRDLNPELDPLARLIPSDQPAVFFPSFQSAAQTADAAQGGDLPVLQLSATRAEDGSVAERYQRQFCLPMSTLARLVGPHVARSVALTGSDPFFPMGTDVAVLFEAPDPAVLETLLLARITLAVQAEKEARPEQGTVEGLGYRGYCSPDRRVSVYVARLGGAVAVSNSLPALGRLALADSGRTPALAGLPEYKFFRDRYRRGDPEEIGLVFLSDATIRRWCGPRWRIADSRRVRALAVLGEIQASQADALVRGEAHGGPVYADLAGPELGKLTLAPAGVRSSVYGGPAFMTPIAEMPLSTVTKAEAEGYGRWRDNYQRNWRWAFDPIALRLGVHNDRLTADLTVMPLIAGSDYRDFAEITRGATFDPQRQDSHDALLHVVLSLNHESRPFRSSRDMLGMMTQGLSVSWIGNSVGVYLDDDPFWQRLAQNPEWRRGRWFGAGMFTGLPLAVRVDVADGLQLAVFLSAARAWVEQTAPGLTLWESLKYQDRAYVRISPTEQARALGGATAVLGAVYYTASGGALLVTPNEEVLKRAIDRQIAADAARAAGKPAPQGRPWLGTNLAVQADARLAEVFSKVAPELYQQALQLQAWNNLPILNEWKRRYPDQDPVAVHNRLWSVKLLSPGGGAYEWSDKWHTMQSTVYGCPAEPKLGPPLSAALGQFHLASFGLTFEPQGLRAQLRLDKK